MHSRSIFTLSRAETPVDLSTLQAPAVLCSRQGRILSATEEARALLKETIALDERASVLPDDLWHALDRVPHGEVLEWRSPLHKRRVLGCTRYVFGECFLLLIKEVSHQNAQLSRRLHRQRLEATGRLVASVAHELRNAVARIRYSAELLDMVGADLGPDALQETVEEILGGGRQLQATVDGLLGYARVGPSVSVPVSLQDVMTRAQGYLRSVYRERTHELHVKIDPDAQWVVGNTLTIEQVFVNLLLNAAEAAAQRSKVIVRVSSDLARPPGAAANDPVQVRVRVVDNGPGVPASLRDSIFEPFVSTSEGGTGLGLPIAIEAVESFGGRLILEDQSPGACFAVYLPCAPLDAPEVSG